MRHRGPQTSREIDPDPIALATIAITGVMMLATVATAIAQIAERTQRRREETRARREDARRERECEAAILVLADQVRSLGASLRDSVRSLERDADLALSFPARGHRDDERRIVADNSHFEIGSRPLIVSGAAREMWTLLVDDVCNNIKDINSTGLAYLERLDDLFEKLRIHETIYSQRRSHKAFYELYSSARRFRKAIAQFQGITARTPMRRARSLTVAVCSAARDLVKDIDRFIELMQ